MSTFKNVISALLSSAMIFSTAIAFANGTYKDVDESTPYYNEIAFATEKGFLNGTDDNNFSPNETVTRAMLITTLGRMDNAKESAGSVFSDVESNSWYTGYVAWAADNKIVEGYEDGTFKPNNTVSRQEALKIFLNYCNYKNVGPTGTWATAISYSDANTIADYAQEAAMWNIIHNYILADENNNIRPTDALKRSELAYALTEIYADTVKEPVAPGDLRYVSYCDDSLVKFRDGEIFVTNNVLVFSQTETLAPDALTRDDLIAVLSEGDKIMLIRSSADIFDAEDIPYKKITEISGNDITFEDDETVDATAAYIFDFSDGKAVNSESLSMGDTAVVFRANELVAMLKMY